MARPLNLNDAYAAAKKAEFEPVILSPGYLLLPTNQQCNLFGVAGRQRSIWFGKARLDEIEWTMAFARVLRHPLTQRLCPAQYRDTVHDFEPNGPFAELLVRQYTERLAKAAPRPNVARRFLRERDVLRIGNVLIHASFENASTKTGYNGYRMKSTREAGEEPLQLPWQQLVDFAVLWLRDELIVELYPWAADPEGLTSDELAGAVRTPKPTVSAPADTLSPEQRVVYFGSGFLAAVAAFADVDSLRVFVQTVRPAAEYLVGKCGENAGTLPTIPDPFILLEALRDLKAREVAVATESERIGHESARVTAEAAALDEQRQRLEALRSDVGATVRRLFAEEEARIVAEQAKLRAAAEMLDSEKGKLLALLMAK